MMKPVVALLVLAYVMPAYSILRRLANRRDDLTITALKVDGLAAVAPAIARDTAGLLGIEWTSGELSLTATTSVRFPGRCRVELSSPESTKVISSVWAQGKKRSEGGEVPALAQAVEALCATLALHSGTDGESRAQLERSLSSLKVETKHVSFGRFNGNVAFVLGDAAEAKPQFWVYKERFLPARLRTADGWDVRFIDYSSQATGDWWPRVVEVYQGAELQLRLTVLSADSKPDLDGVKF
ncbi:MAG: hypothetical protein IT380_01310 [Myxococcales bacterium]|nr:hypothetical protein [Myxococcales bacterium]